MRIQISFLAFLLALAAGPLAATGAPDPGGGEGGDHAACHGAGDAQAPHDHQASAEAEPEVEADAAPVRLPDVELVDQDGRPVHFYSGLVENRVVAMNFVFTTCTTVCPPMGASFGQLQEELGEHLGKDVHLVSVSIDPTTDTPERLKEWGSRFGAGADWTLVTGPKPQVKEVLKALEIFTPDFRDHAPLVLLGNDRTGRWRRAHGFTPPARLAELLLELAAEDGERMASR